MLITRTEPAVNAYQSPRPARCANPVPGPPASPPAYPVTAAPTGMLLTSYAYDQVNHLTQVAMPRNTANGMKTQTRNFVYTPTTYSTLTLPALWLTSATNRSEEHTPEL